MSPFLVGWLEQVVRDYAVLSTLWLSVALLLRPLMRQPAPRVAWGWCVVVGLSGLLLVAAAPGRPRIDSLMPTATQRGAALPQVDRPPPATPLVADSGQHLDASSVERTSIPSDLADEPRVRESAGTGPQSHTPTPELTHLATNATTPALAAPADSLRVRGQVLITSLWPSRSAGSLLVLWIVGAAAGLVWLLLGAIQTRRLKGASQATPAWVDRELNALTAGSRTTPRLLQSARLDTAVALGTARPTIILPSRLVDRGPDPTLSAMLAHEWAHIQHGDLWLLAIQRLLLPFLVLQPLYWWFRRGLARDLELLADAWAARDSRIDYAAAVLAWVGSDAVWQAPPAPSSALTFWPGNSLTARRIEMLLDANSRVATTCSRLSRLGLAGLAAIVLCSLALLPVGDARAGSEGAGDDRNESVVGRSQSGAKSNDLPAAGGGTRSEPAERNADERDPDSGKPESDVRREIHQPGNRPDDTPTPSEKPRDGVERRDGSGRAGRSDGEIALQVADAAAVVRLLEELRENILRRHPKGPAWTLTAHERGRNEVVLSGSPAEIVLVERLIQAEGLQFPKRSRDDSPPGSRPIGSQEIPFSELSPEARVKLLELEVAAATQESRRLQEEEGLVRKGIAPTSARMAAARELEQAEYRMQRARIQLDDLRERPMREQKAAVEAQRERDRRRAARGATRLKLKELDVRLAQQELQAMEASLNEALRLREKGVIPDSELRHKESLAETARLKFEQAKLFLEEAQQELESN